MVITGDSSQSETARELPDSWNFQIYSPGRYGSFLTQLALTRLVSRDGNGKEKYKKKNNAASETFPNIRDTPSYEETVLPVHSTR